VRIIYGSPPSSEPSGGVKVIYKHVEVLNSLGVESYVWLPANPDFDCNWFDQKAPLIPTHNLNPKTDFLIIPEIWASLYVSLLKGMGFKVGIFVQNCYLTHVNLNSNNKNAVLEAYAAADLMLSISNDTSRYLVEILGVPQSKIVLQRYHVDRSLFCPTNKDRVITFMPRKMKDHSARVVSAIDRTLPPGWSLLPLDQLSERQVASALSRSMLFLAFSEFEGLPVPPVEAALSGNIVIGYHGQGGREYWRRPNFIEIDQGDIQGFVFEVLDALQEIVSGQINLPNLNSGIVELADYFSAKRELEMLQNLIDAVVPLSMIAQPLYR